LEQLVYTYIHGRIAGEVGVFDSKVSIVVDGPSKLHRVRRKGHCFWSVSMVSSSFTQTHLTGRVGQEGSAIDVTGCTRGYENGSSLKQ
jgi:hypothetical protein